MQNKVPDRLTIMSKAVLMDGISASWRLFSYLRDALFAWWGSDRQWWSDHLVPELRGVLRTELADGLLVMHPQLGWTSELFVRRWRWVKFFGVKFFSLFCRLSYLIIAFSVPQSSDKANRSFAWGYKLIAGRSQSWERVYILTRVQWVRNLNFSSPFQADPRQYITMTASALCLQNEEALIDNSHH